MSISSINMRAARLIALAILLTLASRADLVAGESEEEQAAAAISEREVLEFVQQKYPDILAHVDRVRRVDPEEYEEIVDRGREILIDYRYIRGELGDDVAVQFLRVTRLEWKVEDLADAFHDAPEGKQDEISNNSKRSSLSSTICDFKSISPS